MDIRRVGDFTLGWGESVVWDDERDRLYFVDCAARRCTGSTAATASCGPYGRPRCRPASCRPTTGASSPCSTTVSTSSIPTRARACSRPYPRSSVAAPTMRRRPRRQPDHRQAQPGTRRGLGVEVLRPAGVAAPRPRHLEHQRPHGGRLRRRDALIVGDTSADYSRIRTTRRPGALGARTRVFGDVSGLDGFPDGSTSTADDGLWCAWSAAGSSSASPRWARPYGGGARRQPHRRDLRRSRPRPSLRRLGRTAGRRALRLAGALLVIDGLGVQGRPEPRFGS